MPQTVLITGASGFIAAHIIENFLAAGYHIRGTIRSESTAQRIRDAHPKYQDALSFTVVPDIAVPGAFDEAVKGVDGVSRAAHTPEVLGMSLR